MLPSRGIREELQTGIPACALLPGLKGEGLSSQPSPPCHAGPQSSCPERSLDVMGEAARPRHRYEPGTASVHGRGLCLQLHVLQVWYVSAHTCQHMAWAPPPALLFPALWPLRLRVAGDSFPEEAANSFVPHPQCFPEPLQAFWKGYRKKRGQQVLQGKQLPSAGGAQPGTPGSSELLSYGLSSQNRPWCHQAAAPPHPRAVRELTAHLLPAPGKAFGSTHS